jgi:hypothetical protein
VKAGKAKQAKPLSTKISDEDDEDDEDEDEDDDDEDG